MSNNYIVTLRDFHSACRRTHAIHVDCPKSIITPLEAVQRLPLIVDPGFDRNLISSVWARTATLWSHNSPLRVNGARWISTENPTGSAKRRPGSGLSFSTERPHSADLVLACYGRR